MQVCFIFFNTRFLFVRVFSNWESSCDLGWKVVNPSLLWVQNNHSISLQFYLKPHFRMGFWSGMTFWFLWVVTHDCLLNSFFLCVYSFNVIKLYEASLNLKSCTDEVSIPVKHFYMIKQLPFYSLSRNLEILTHAV